MEADLREQANAKRFSKMEERLLVGSKKLDPLVCGDTVVVQNQAVTINFGVWWNSSTELQPEDSMRWKYGDFSGKLFFFFILWTQSRFQILFQQV